MSSRDEWPPRPEPLPAPVVDNHTHLDLVRHDLEVAPLSVEDALAAAAEAGVARIVQIGCDLPSSRAAVQMSATYASVAAGVALHPNEAPTFGSRAELDAALEEIEALATTHDKVRVVGETGLDFFRTEPEGRAEQEYSFRRHVDIAKRLDKTLQIHDRDAHREVLDTLDSEGAPERWVMHCFSGDADFARACLDRGAWLSFAGTVTFKNAGGLREALAVTPLDRVLVETDAPFLTPMPYRGAPNSSYMVAQTLRLMAEVRGEDLETLCLAVDENTNSAFGGSWG